MIGGGWGAKGGWGWVRDVGSCGMGVEVGRGDKSGAQVEVRTTETEHGSNTVVEKRPSEHE